MAKRWDKIKIYRIRYIKKRKNTQSHFCSGSINLTTIASIIALVNNYTKSLNVLELSFAFTEPFVRMFRTFPPIKLNFSFDFTELPSLQR